MTRGQAKAETASRIAAEEAPAAPAPTPDMAASNAPDTAQDGAQQQSERRKRATAWLERASRPAKPFITAAAVCGIANGVLIIVQMAVLALVLHRLIIETAPLTDQAVPLLVLGGVIAGRAALAYWQERFGIRAAHRVERRLREQLMARIEQQGPALANAHETGSLAAHAIEHLQALEGYLARYRPQAIIAGVLPLLIIAAVAPINWVVALIFLVTGPLAPLFMALIGMSAASASAQQFETLARMGGHFLDRLRGLTTLKLYGQAQAECDAIEEVAEDFRTRTMKVLRIAFLSSAVLEFFSTVAIALVALYVGLGLLDLVNFGPVADVTLFSGLFVLLLAPEFFQPLRQLGSFYHDRASGLGAAETLMTLIDADDAARPPRRRERHAPAPLSAPPALTFQDVALRFEDGRSALAGVSFHVAPGECVALMGPSGAGKSSVLNLLLGFATPTHGMITLAGAPHDAALVRASSAWVGQRAHLFHASIRDNIRLGIPDADDAAVEDAARAAHVMDFAAHVPTGLDTLVGERGFGLSGGQIQRVALARAFLKDAALLLFDEPTANLDKDSEALVLDAMARLIKGRTALIATHSEAAAKLADRVLTIRDGRLEEVAS